MPPDSHLSEEIQNEGFSLSEFLNEALSFSPSHPMFHRNTRMPDEWQWDILTNLLSSPPPLPSPAASSSIPSKRPILSNSEHSRSSKIARKNDGSKSPSLTHSGKTSTASEFPSSPSLESSETRQPISVNNTQSRGISYSAMGELLTLAGRHPGKECSADEVISAFWKSLSEDNSDFKRQLAAGSSAPERGENETGLGQRTMYTCNVTSCRRSMTTSQSLRSESIDLPPEFMPEEIDIGKRCADVTASNNRPLRLPYEHFHEMW